MTACQKDILLLFPPHWAFTMPHLSLPCLHGALTAAGHDATLFDVNLDYHRWLFSAKGVNELKFRISTRISELEKKCTLSPTEASHLRGLVIGAAVAKRLRAQIDHAAAVLSTEDFYNPHLISWATGCLADSYGLVGKAFFPSSMDFVAFHSSGNPTTPKGLAEITQDNEANPYKFFFAANTIPAILDINPKLIGISISAETQWVAALTLCRMLRESGCKAVVVLGGGVLTRMADILATQEGALHDYCDVIALGEGEDTIVAFADRISHNRPIDDIPNTIAYLSDGIIRRNPGFQHIPFREIPSPNFSGLCLSRYFVPKPVLPVMLARGCYHRKCAFCDHSAAYNTDHRSSRSVPDIVMEIKRLRQRYGTTCFAFADEALPVSAIRGITAELEKEESNLSIAACFRGKGNITAEDWRKFSVVGLRLAQFGIESGSQTVLDAMRKGTIVESVENSLTQASEVGVWNHGFIMFGFPGETKEDALQTISFVERNRKGLHSVGASRFHLMRNSAIAENPTTFSVSMENANLWSLVYPHVPMRGMTVAEADTECATFNRNIVPSLPGAALWRCLERAQLLLYLDRYSRDTTLAFGDELESRNPASPQSRAKLPIDIELQQLTHDLTISGVSVKRSGSLMSQVIDIRHRNISLLSDAAWSAVKAWRDGSSLAATSHRLLSEFGGDYHSAKKEIGALWSDLCLADPNIVIQEPFFNKKTVLAFHAAIEAPKGLPDSALPEWLGVVSRLKPGMRITLYGWTKKQYEEFSRSVAQRGLVVRFGKFRPDGLAHLSPYERDLALSAAPVYAYIAPSASLADRLVEAENKSSRILGEALGYPSCCVRWLSWQDAVDTPKGRPANLPISGLQNTIGPRFSELNNLLWHLPAQLSPFYLISHYPCSYNCSHSLTSAQDLHKEITRRSSDIAHIMKAVLSRPVLIWDDISLPQEYWDENKGLVFDGSVISNRIRFNGCMSLRKERDYSDLGLSFSDELIVTEDRVLGMRLGQIAGCWWAAEHGQAHIFDFRWKGGKECT